MGENVEFPENISVNYPEIPQKSSALVDGIWETGYTRKNAASSVGMGGRKEGNVMKRKAGILLSVTSLPSAYGIGDLGQAAYDFADFLEQAGQSYWQILPLGATGHGSADSPYQAYSAFAGNPYLISLQMLQEQGLLTQQECTQAEWGKDPRTVDYDCLHKSRRKLLRKAYERSHITENPDFCRFAGEQAFWLEDYALFMALKEFFGDSHWKTWPHDIRMRWQNALDYYNEKLYFEIEFHKFTQYIFYTQWAKLKTYINKKHLEIVGDIPIYVSGDSADVWAHPELFQMDEELNCTDVAGCPPDDFTPEGQLWGNPLYRWNYHRQTGFHWWTDRMRQSFQLYDLVRIDHFRGFDAYYAIPAESKTAKDGRWVDGPGLELFQEMTGKLGKLPIIAEDLGLMTDSVRKLVRDTGYPNMKVLQFAFGPNDKLGENDHLPHNYGKNCVVYTGTHDNMTLAGWLAGLTRGEVKAMRTYLGDHHTPVKQLGERILDMAHGSVAETCIIPMQDYLGLGKECRMNTPGTVTGNWRWRVKREELTDTLAQEILETTMRYGRVNPAVLPEEEPELIEE